MIRCLVPLFLSAFTLVASANADIKQGTTELAIFGNLTSINFEDGAAGDADSEDTGALAVGLGYFHTREIEVGLHAIGNWSKDLDLYNVGGNVKYHFTPDLTSIPYVGGQLNYASYDSYRRDEQGIMYGPLAGVRYFVSRSVSIFFEYQYQIYDGDVDEIIEDAHSLFLGILFKIQ
jgi:hypothetical protein